MKLAPTVIVALLILMFCISAGAEEVLYKISLGPGGGIFKTGGVYDYLAMGTTYGGLAKFGITKDLEIGIQGAYMYTYPGSNIDFYPFLLRNASSGNVYQHTAFHPPGNRFQYCYGSDCNRPMAIIDGDTTYTRSYLERARYSMDSNPNLPFRLEFIPIELFLQWRSFTQTIFNPYVQFGGGLIMWSVKDDKTNEVVQIADERNTYGWEETFVMTDYSSLNWKDYKGRHFQAMLGVGFEIFPVEQVGIDIGLRGYYAFLDDFATYT
ncbi:MAG TPA: hypothetical protein ENN75_03980, partial [candidate division Zixibacteria bacterium]|nr:hypothetical protein [candidate division Zixibacteria bacterium]